MKRDCVLTFDYELFMGDNPGSALHSVIKPTNRIIELFKKYDARGIFYVDAGYLLKLREYEHPDLQLITRQLRQLVEMGSSIELHIHPQWLDAIFDGKNWSFSSFEKFRLHSLDSTLIGSYFSDCKEILEDISGVPVSSFRAGGWCLQPFDQISVLFERSGIKLDSSVIPGFTKNDLPHHYFDYESVGCLNIYKFDSDPCVESETGRFVELPVTTHRIHGMTLFINTFMLKLYDNRLFGDGIGLYKSDGLCKKLRRVFSYNMRTLSVEGMFPKLFCHEFERWIQNKECLPCLVMHPKTISELALINLEYVCRTSNMLNTTDVLERV